MKRMPPMKLMLVAALGLAAGTASAGGDDRLDHASRIFEHTTALDYLEAHKKLEGLDLESPAVAIAAARLAIYEHDCDAAVTLLAGPGTPAEANSSDPDQARALVDATLAEADRRSAAMKFEVGPPPLNLSRGRRSGS